MDIEAALRKIADWPTGEGRRTLVLPDDGSGWQSAVTTDHHDAVGCLVWEIEASRKAPPGNDSLEGWAHRAAMRVTSLLERLKVVEVDQQRNEALLRSETPGVPARSESGSSYYEIVLQGTQRASVRRFRGPKSRNRREQVAFALTNEMLARLLADLLS
jgi:hypothetical protein